MNPTSESQSVCPLCKIVGNEKVELDFSVDGASRGDTAGKFFIVATKMKKGHDFRFMVVHQDHVRTIDRKAEMAAIGEFFKFMKQFGVDFAIMESTHATVADHWHRVATDLKPGADDNSQIGDTDRFEVRFKKAKDSHSRELPSQPS